MKSRISVSKLYCIIYLSLCFNLNKKVVFYIFIGIIYFDYHFLQINESLFYGVFKRCRGL